MQTWSNLTWKTFEQLEAGDLAIARISGDYALLFKFNAEGAGILNGPDNAKGLWFPASVNTRCMSLGSSWFLDVTPDEHLFPENPNAHNANTILFFGQSGFQWKFRPHSNINDEIYVPLLGGNPTYHMEQHAAPVLRWSIWESEKHRMAAGTEPLVQFPAAPN